jgi:nucleoside-diphosphate-sugar epimerase
VNARTRVLVLDAGHFAGQRVAAALGVSSWASPVVQAPGQTLEQAIRSVDAVANCTVGDPGRIVRAARELYTVAGTLPEPIPVVHLGSMTVYGRGSGLVGEDAPLSGELGSYAAAQCEAEGFAAAYQGAIRLRPGCEYGPGCTAWSGRIAQLLLHRRLGDLGAAGDGRCNLLYINDLVAAVLAALRRSELRGLAINLSLPEPPTWNEYLIRFALALGATPVRRISPRRLAVEAMFMAPPLKILEVGGDRLGLTLPKRFPPLTSSLLSTCSQEITLDVRRAQHLLDMQWTPLAEGLRRASDWCLASTVS